MPRWSVRSGASSTMRVPLCLSGATEAELLISDPRRIEIPHKIVVKLQCLHVTVHVDLLVDGVNVFGAALPSRRPAINIPREA